MTSQARIRQRDRDTILQSLAAGVVPRRGQHHIQVGRSAEITAFISDLDRIADGGSAIRIVIGEYGSGKTFFLQLVRSVALEKNLVTVHADLSPDRRLHASAGQGRSLYSELARNASTRSMPDGGALASVVERFISSSLNESRTSRRETVDVIHERLTSLTELVGGYDFAAVVAAYWTGHETGNDELKGNAVRWLRAEYSTKTEARQCLNVRTIIDDSNLYDSLKLLARFVRLAGYKGLLVVLDELVNLYKLANTQARLGNYEEILRILNDCLQGSAESIGFIMGGTPEFLLDTRRGLYSYQALETRLAENRFAVDGYKDLSGPVIRLTNLSPEEIYVLLTKLRNLQAYGDATRYLVPDQALVTFMEFCSKRIGDAYFRTPRNTIKAFVQLLQVLEQNPSADWRELLGAVSIEQEHAQTIEEFEIGETNQDDNDELTTFRL